MTTDDGWVVTPKPAPPELSSDFEAPPFDASLPFEHAHVTGWASFGELIGADGVKALAKAVL